MLVWCSCVQSISIWVGSIIPHVHKQFSSVLRSLLFVLAARILFMTDVYNSYFQGSCDTHIGTLCWFLHVAGTFCCLFQLFTLWHASIVKFQLYVAVCDVWPRLNSHFATTKSWELVCIFSRQPLQWSTTWRWCRLSKRPTKPWRSRMENSM